MPTNDLTEIKEKIDTLKTRLTVLNVKASETKKKISKRYNVSTIEGAKAIRSKLEKKVSKMEAKAAGIIEEVKAELEEFDDYDE